MDVAFSSLRFSNYVASVGYDQCLNLYSLDENEKQKLKFSYQNEDQELGYFTHVAFDHSSKNNLVFAVSTSNGYILLFSSENSFEPKKYLVAEEKITGVDFG